jgi:hypothetical protein
MRSKVVAVAVVLGSVALGGDHLAHGQTKPVTMKPPSRPMPVQQRTPVAAPPPVAAPAPKPAAPPAKPSVLKPAGAKDTAPAPERAKPAAAPEAPKLPPVPPSLSLPSLRVTLGNVKAVGNALAIRDAKVRFYAPSTLPTVHAGFTYLGPTKDTAPLASGIIRRQLGLKLKAKDGCNVVYAVWRFSPVNELVVSVKSNPGKATHAACGANGYTDIKPAVKPVMPEVPPGSKHSLDAVLNGSDLKVFADGKLAWDGKLPNVAFDGPSGLRTDNASVDVEFGAPVQAAGAAKVGAPTLSLSNDED